MQNSMYYPNDTNKGVSILAGYFQAANWTEELTFDTVDKESWNNAYQDCYTFMMSILDSEEYHKLKFIMKWDNPEMTCSMGHDLWLTRNHHGAGFWDKPELWGDCANLFTKLAEALGEKYAYVENNVLYFE